MNIQKGSIRIYRIFDVAEEIDLTLAEKILNDSRRDEPFQVPRTIDRALVLRSTPILLKLPSQNIRTKNYSFEACVSAKIRDYGVITLQYEIPIPKSTDWKTLVRMAAELEDNTDIDAKSKAHSLEITQMLKNAMKDHHSWDVFEDYAIYFLERFEGLQTAAELKEKADIPALLLAEENAALSPLTRNAILENIYQYGNNDLAVIEWNSALVVEPDGKEEVLDLLEISLTHLMEMRYYDDLLDHHLNVLYDNIEKGKKKKSQRSDYSQLYRDASTRYIEFSEFIERVENSLKVVGDFYLATVYRAANKRFRLADWQQNIMRKMNILAQVSALLQGEVNMRRSHWMELTVIALILFEIVSAILKWH